MSTLSAFDRKCKNRSPHQVYAFVAYTKDNQLINEYCTEKRVSTNHTFENAMILGLRTLGRRSVALRSGGYLTWQQSLWALCNERYRPVGRAAARRYLQALVAAKVLELQPDGSVYIANWATHHADRDDPHWDVLRNRDRANGRKRSACYRARHGSSESGKWSKTSTNTGTCDTVTRYNKRTGHDPEQRPEANEPSKGAGAPLDPLPLQEQPAKTQATVGFVNLKKSNQQTLSADIDQLENDLYGPPSPKPTAAPAPTPPKAPVGTKPQRKAPESVASILSKLPVPSMSAPVEPAPKPAPQAPQEPPYAAPEVHVSNGVKPLPKVPDNDIMAAIARMRAKSHANQLARGQDPFADASDAPAPKSVAQGTSSQRMTPAPKPLAQVPTPPAPPKPAPKPPQSAQPPSGLHVGPPADMRAINLLIDSFAERWEQKSTEEVNRLAVLRIGAPYSLVRAVVEQANDKICAGHTLKSPGAYIVQALKNQMAQQRAAFQRLDSACQT